MHAPLRAVDHDRHARDLRFAADQIQKARHRRFRIDHSFVHVDVEDVGAAFHLLPRDGQRASKSPARISFENFGEPVMFVRSPTTTKPISGVMFSGSSPEIARRLCQTPCSFGSAPAEADALQFVAWLAIAHRVRNRADVIRRRPATAADNIQPAVRCPLLQLGREVSGVSGKPVGESGSGSPAFGYALT